MGGRHELEVAAAPYKPPQQQDQGHADALLVDLNPRGQEKTTFVVDDEKYLQHASERQDTGGAGKAATTNLVEGQQEGPDFGLVAVRKRCLQPILLPIERIAATVSAIRAVSCSSSSGTRARRMARSRSMLGYSMLR